jgi:hypothetical protein
MTPSAAVLLLMVVLSLPVRRLETWKRRSPTGWFAYGMLLKM